MAGHAGKAFWFSKCKRQFKSEALVGAVEK